MPTYATEPMVITTHPLDKTFPLLIEPLIRDRARKGPIGSFSIVGPSQAFTGVLRAPNFAGADVHYQGLIYKGRLTILSARVAASS